MALLGAHHILHISWVRVNIQQLCALPTLHLCALYLSTTNDLCHLHHKLAGFITEKKSVYCAVRNESLSKAVFHSSLKG